MRIAIALMGSRGEVQPGVALGLELQRRGHDVIVAVPKNLAHLATRTGLPALVIDIDSIKDFESDALVQELTGGSQTKAILKAALTAVPSVRKKLATIADAILEISRDADLIIATQITEFLCAPIATAWGIAITTIHHHPHRKNSFFLPPTLAPQRELSKKRVRAYWDLFDKYQILMGRLFWTKLLKKRLHVKSVRPTAPKVFAEQNVVELQAYYSDLVPGLAEEWDSRRPFVGPLRLLPEFRVALGENVDLVDDLSEWFENGPKPIFFGFGSIPHGKTAEEVVALAASVCAKLGQRGLVNFGGKTAAELPELPPETARHVRVVGAIAHDAVFPRCSAVVVQGGIGTLNEALRAGVPALVCWVAFDQPYWGIAVKHAGVGDHVQFSAIDEAVLEQKIPLLLDPATQRRAKELGERLRAQKDGAVFAAEIVDTRILNAKPRSRI